MALYNRHHRRFQERFQSRNLADKMQDIVVREEITSADKTFIEAQEFFFLSTITADRCPTVSYKGGNQGFVTVQDNKTLAFPSYNGNGMFLSMGNIQSNPAVGLLFINFEHPHRIRFHGHASVLGEHKLMQQYPEAELLVEVKLSRMWVNCPRYIPRMQKLKDSANIPKPGLQTPLADWKKLDLFQDVLPPDDQRRVNDEGGSLSTQDYAALLDEDR